MPHIDGVSIWIREVRYDPWGHIRAYNGSRINGKKHNFAGFGEGGEFGIEGSLLFLAGRPGLARKVRSDE
jgi:hypothetical protein